MKIEQNAAYGKVTVAAYPFRVLGKNCSQSMKHLYHSLVDLSKSFPVYMVGCTWFSYQNIILTLLHYSLVTSSDLETDHEILTLTMKNGEDRKYFINNTFRSQTFKLISLWRIKVSFISTKETKLTFQTTIYPILYFIQYWLLLYL